MQITHISRVYKKLSTMKLISMQDFFSLTSSDLIVALLLCTENFLFLALLLPQRTANLLCALNVFPIIVKISDHYFSLLQIALNINYFVFLVWKWKGKKMFVYAVKMRNFLSYLWMFNDGVVVCCMLKKINCVAGCISSRCWKFWTKWI